MTKVKAQEQYEAVLAQLPERDFPRWGTEVSDLPGVHVEIRAATLGWLRVLPPPTSSSDMAAKYRVVWALPKHPEVDVTALEPEAAAIALKDSG